MLPYSKTKARKPELFYCNISLSQVNLCLNRMKNAIMQQKRAVLCSFRLKIAAFFMLCAGLANAMEIKTLPLGNTQAIVVIVDSRQDQLQLFLQDQQGKPLQSFQRVQQQLGNSRLKLAFAMNAGMFHPDYTPVGLYVAQHKQLFPLNDSSGFGNFFIQPNGVFFKDAEGFHVLTTQDYAQQQTRLKPVLATQSGPMLVTDGVINPHFNAGSDSVYVRNAVGVLSPRHAVFVITAQPVNFYALADFFKNTLQVKDALYLDGSISSLYLPDMQRDDNQRLLGPIIGVVQPAD